MRQHRNCASTLVLALALLASPFDPVSASTPEVVSVAISAPTEPAGGADLPSVSADGRFVAFHSSSPDLVAGDTNGLTDVFVFDRLTATTTLVSLSSAGIQGNAQSLQAAISADGRFVAFESEASNLVAGDTNGTRDIFLHDRVTGVTTRVSVATDGTEIHHYARLPSVSGDGQFVAFSSYSPVLVVGDTNGVEDVFVHDRLTGTTSRASVGAGGVQGDGSSSSPKLSADGRYVAFDSTAENFVAGFTNGLHVFVRDQVTGAIEAASVNDAGAPGNAGNFGATISGDGRYVAFESWSTNLAPGDDNGNLDVFVRDRLAATTTRVSIGSGPGGGSSPAISSDGRFVAFSSPASDLVAGDTNAARDIFVRDQTNSVTTRVSVDSSGQQADGQSAYPTISRDGRIVAFASVASNLVPGDSNHGSDIFVHDRTTSLTERTPDVAQPPPAGAPVLGDAASVSSTQALNEDGQLVAFASEATNLVPQDDNGVSDVFVRDRTARATTRISMSSLGEPGDGPSRAPAISANGRYVAFESAASNLVPGDGNAATDIFVHDRSTQATTRVSTGPAGSEADASSSHPSISGDGRYVAFVSSASNLVAGDTNGVDDVFVHDRQSGATLRASLDSAGTQGNGASNWPSISSDGRFVAFGSAATNLVLPSTNPWPGVFVRDLVTGVTTRASLANDGSQSPAGCYEPSISGNGRYVAFRSMAYLAPFPTIPESEAPRHQDPGVWDQIFVRDLLLGTTTKASVGESFGTPNSSNGHCREPAISRNGQRVAFASPATTLSTSAQTGYMNVYVRDIELKRTTLVSANGAGVAGYGASYSASISPSGGATAFVSTASDFVPGGDNNGFPDVFVRLDLELFRDGFEGGGLEYWSLTPP